MRSHPDRPEDDATMATNGDDVKSRLKIVEQKIEGLDQKFEALDRKFEAMRIQFEEVREDIKKFGEGVDQGFRATSRQIKNLDRKWTDKWDTHHLALKDHADRISTLEQRK